MEKVEELELVELSDEQFESLGKLRGSVFKDFLKMGTKQEELGMDEADLFGLFMKRELETIGVYVDDVYEQLEIDALARLMTATMELNNMEELFRSLNRLNRGFTPTDAMDE